MVTVEVHHKLALSVPEAAAMLGLSEPSVRRLVDAGRLARVPHTGNRVLIARTELERFVNAKPSPLAVAS